MEGPFSELLVRMDATSPKVQSDPWARWAYERLCVLQPQVETGGNLGAQRTVLHLRGGRGIPVDNRVKVLGSWTVEPAALIPNPGLGAR
jgi:hypothetical protein